MSIPRKSPEVAPGCFSIAMWSPLSSDALPDLREVDSPPDWWKQDLVASIAGSGPCFSKASWWFEVRFSRK